MNVFVLCTGRCGSTTFAQACRHLTNYSVGHESQAALLGDPRVRYVDRHIEVDNRLSWFLGRLGVAYGNGAFYVHLRRDRRATAESFVRRYDSGIMAGYRHAILMGLSPTADPLDVALDYVDTVTANIEHFLRGKRAMTFHLEDAREHFTRFWRCIQAEGDLEAALAEWSTRHNRSES